MNTQGNSVRTARRSWGFDLVLFPVVAVVVVFLLVFVPLGLLAVVSMDGLNESMHQGLGQASPVPQRIFRALQGLPWLWPGVLAGAVGHVLLRRLLKKTMSFGTSLGWDALGSPLLGAGAAALVVAAVLGTRAPGNVNDIVVSVLVTLGAGFALLSIAGLALCLLRRHRALRRAAAVALAVAIAARIGSEAWGRVALAGYRSRQAPERAAIDQQRAARERPLVSEPALDEDAWPRYRKLIDDLRADREGLPSLQDLMGSGEPDPFAPTPARAKAVLDSRRAEVASLREAVRCRRCVPEVIDSPSARIPSLLGVRHLAVLAGLEGNERAAAGDLEGAAQRYLEIVRVGGDIGDGNLIHGLVGISVEDRGLRALGRLVRSGRCSATLVDRMRRVLAELREHRTSLSACLRNERRMMAGLEQGLDLVSPEAPLILPAVIPYRALAARAQQVADRISRRHEEVLAQDELEGWRRLVAETDAEAGNSWNPYMRILTGYTALDTSGTFSLRFFLTARRQVALFRLVEAGLLLEDEKRLHGRYPDDASGFALPKDPLALDQPLRYRREGASYVLWSVGLNGVDDGGRSEHEDDLVL